MRKRFSDSGIIWANSVIFPNFSVFIPLCFPRLRNGFLFDAEKWWCDFAFTDGLHFLLQIVILRRIELSFDVGDPDEGNARKGSD